MDRDEEVSEATVTIGSGNVFADLELDDAEELLAKAKLLVAIKDILKQRKLTQIRAAKVMGIDQPRVSKLLRGRLTEFSTEALMQYLVRLGSDVEILVHKPAAAGKTEGALTVAYL